MRPSLARGPSGGVETRINQRFSGGYRVCSADFISGRCLICGWGCSLWNSVSTYVLTFSKEPKPEDRDLHSRLLIGTNKFLRPLLSSVGVQTSFGNMIIHQNDLFSKLWEEFEIHQNDYSPLWFYFPLLWKKQQLPSTLCSIWTQTQLQWRAHLGVRAFKVYPVWAIMIL